MRSTATGICKWKAALIAAAVAAAACALALMCAPALAQNAYADEGPTPDFALTAQLQTQDKGDLTLREGKRTIELNKTYKGMIPDLEEDERQVDTKVSHKYNFTLDDPSEVSFVITTEIEPRTLDNGDDISAWFSIKLSGTTLEYTKTITLADKTKWKFGTMCLLPGDYTLEVYVWWDEGEYAPNMLGHSYTVRVNAEAVGKVEIEPNDLYGQADPIKLNKPITGSLYDLDIPDVDSENFADDYDWYRFKVTKETTVRLHVATGVPSTYVHDPVIDQNWTATASLIHKKSEAPLFSGQIYGDGDWWSESITLKPGTYRICLYGAQENELWGEGYQLTVVAKKANPLTVQPASKAPIAKTSTTTKIKKAKAFVIKKAKGDVTFTKLSGKKNITIAQKTGTITVKKGLKAGIYKLKVMVKAAGNDSYESATKTVTVKIRVKKG